MAGKKIILAIDDNVQQLTEFKNILSSQYDLRAVKSASEAMSFLNRNSSDLILLDIEMPNISGFEFLHDIKRIPSYIHVPIIIISGHTGQEFHAQVKNSEANGYLTKPVRPETLIDTIEKALAKKT